MSETAPPVPVEQHLARILDRISALPSVPHSLLEAVGRPIAAPVVARRDLPAFDNSSMDGYAVHTADLATANVRNPLPLPVVAEIHAGDTAQRTLRPGTTMRIMTGAPMPAGADAVVPIEAADGGSTEVRFTAAVKEGDFIRRVGEDIHAGDTVLASGSVLGARQVGLVAGLGIDRIFVASRPRVVVLATGAELVEPGKPLPRGAIHDANSYMLAAAVRATGATAYRVVVPDDDPATFTEVLEDQLVRADLVITTGGVSKGTRDVVKEALRGESTMWFGEVAMQPGKPQGFGTVGEDKVPLFALPGNPVSAYVSFEVFVAPALRRMIGRTPEERPLFRAALSQPVRSIRRKCQFLRGTFSIDATGAHVAPSGGPGSHLLGGLGAANALIVLGESLGAVDEGASVPVMLLDREY